ncbi:MAG: Fe-S cluster assembly scaffold IscU [Planctomycetota bacterium]
MAYSKQLIDHYENPRNVGTFGTTKELKDRADVGVGIVGAPECGDVMQLQLQIGDDGTVQDAKFKTFGCGSAIACSSLATEWLKGNSLEDAMKIKNTDMVEELPLPPVKIHCSVLAEDAIRAAVKDYNTKNGKADEAHSHDHHHHHEH